MLRCVDSNMSEMVRTAYPDSLGRASDFSDDAELPEGAQKVPVERSPIPEHTQKVLENMSVKVMLEQLNMRIAGLEARLDKELGDLKATMHVRTAAEQGCQTASAAEAEEAQGVKEIRVSWTRSGLERLNELDENVYKLQESMWDCCVLFGFHCIGMADQLMVVIGALVNASLQILLSIIINENLANNPFDIDNLIEGAKSWRASVAHNVMYANAITQVSLASEVCGGSSGLPYSTTQNDLYEDLDSYLNPPFGSIATTFGTTLEALNGKLLCRLALLLFFWHLLKDMVSNYHMALALWTQPAGPARMLIDDKGDVAIVSVSYKQVLFVTILAILPRLAVEIVLCASGSRYIVYTMDLGDLVLNALALVFILDLDELSYQVLAPGRVKSLLSKIGSMQVNSKSFHMKLLPFDVPVAITLVCSAVAVVVVNMGILEPFHGQIQDAHTWLCGGNKEFIYSINKANGIPKFTESQDFEGNFAATFAEMAVLNFAGLVTDSSTLGPLATMADLASRQKFLIGTWDQVSRIALEDTGYSASDGAGFSPSQCVNLFDNLWELANDSDLIMYKKVARYLLHIEMGNLSVASCADIPIDVCLQGSLAGTYARYSCPQKCGCMDPSFGNAYATNEFGCPSSCSLLWDIGNHYNFGWGEVWHHDPDRPCKDWSYEALQTTRPNTSQRLFNLNNFIETKSGIYRSLGWPHSHLEVVKSVLLSSGCQGLSFGWKECSVESGHSLRSVCPVSCKCNHPWLDDRSECPRTCVSNLTVVAPAELKWASGAIRHR